MNHYYTSDLLKGAKGSEFHTFNVIILQQKNNFVQSKVYT